MNFILRISSLLLLTVVLFGSCKKKKGETINEENLVVAINPDPGSGNATATGPTYSFSITIQSTMPPQGVDVQVEYRQESNNSVLFSQTLSSTTSPINVNINNIPTAAAGTVTVKVTSKSKASNTVTKTFRLVRK